MPSARSTSSSSARAQDVDLRGRLRRTLNRSAPRQSCAGHVPALTCLFVLAEGACSKKEPRWVSQAPLLAHLQVHRGTSPRSKETHRGWKTTGSSTSTTTCSTCARERHLRVDQPRRDPDPRDTGLSMCRSGAAFVGRWSCLLRERVRGRRRLLGVGGWRHALSRSITRGRKPYSFHRSPTSIC